MDTTKRKVKIECELCVLEEALKALTAAAFSAHDATRYARAKKLKDYSDALREAIDGYHA